MRKSIRVFVSSVTPLLVIGAFAFSLPQARADDVDVRMFAPHNGDTVGSGGFGWFVDLAVRFDAPLEGTGFSGLQLTGPGAHANVAPFPGAFSAGADDRMPGLIVLVSTATVGAKSCQNLANLFNLTGITDTDDSATELRDTWLVGAPLFGVNTPSTVLAAVAADENDNRVFDDAPDVVPDADGDGTCDEKDLKASGIASRVAKAKIFIAGPPVSP
jgi:hypothetical protein